MNTSFYDLFYCFESMHSALRAKNSVIIKVYLTVIVNELLILVQ